MGLVSLTWWTHTIYNRGLGLKSVYNILFLPSFGIITCLFKCCQILIDAQKYIKPTSNHKCRNLSWIKQKSFNFGKKKIINQEIFDSIQKSLHLTDFFSVRMLLQMISGWLIRMKCYKSFKLGFNTKGPFSN